ncbi:50S ribosomal protein L35 [Candidatus Peregrinibacteria bacterium]|nr:50S ribosomal protein L35 [Candidatus Peregrinibacteria bacterium]
MKQKTHSGAKKRVKKTGSGKYVVEKSCKRHLLVNKSKRQKKLDKKGKVAEKPQQKMLSKLLT